MRALRKLLTPKGTGDRGATLVEYVLIAAVLVVGAIFAIRYMASAASSEQASQSECIGVRPAPAECTADFRVGTSTTTGGSGGNGGEVSTTTTVLVTTTTSTTTTTTTAPTTTTTSPVATTSTTAPRTFSGTGTWYSYSRENKSRSRWEGSVTVRIRDSRNRNLENADVVIRWRTAGGEGTLDCETNGDGRCDVSLTTSDSNQYIDFYIESVDGLPLSSPPAAQRVLQP